MTDPLAQIASFTALTLAALVFMILLSLIIATTWAFNSGLLQWPRTKEEWLKEYNRNILWARAVVNGDIPCSNPEIMKTAKALAPLKTTFEEPLR